MLRALLIIDMQRDFVSPDAPLCVEGAARTVPAIAAFADFARQKGWSVIHVVRAHAADGSDAEPFRAHLFTEGDGYCVRGTEGAEIVDGLRPEAEDLVVEKTRFSGFFRTRLDEVLERSGVTDLYIAGTQYPNCIRATAVDAMSRDLRVTVLKDCCSAQTEETAEANIRDMEQMNVRCVLSTTIMNENQ